MYVYHMNVVLKGPEEENRYPGTGDMNAPHQPIVLVLGNKAEP